MGREIKDLIIPSFHVTPEVKELVLRASPPLRREAKSALNEIRRLGIKTSICSNAPRVWGEFLLKEWDIASCFDTTIFYDDKDALRKPDPRMLLKLIKSSNAQSVWMVGDGVPDMQTAFAAQAQTHAIVTPIAVSNSRANGYLVSQRFPCNSLIISNLSALSAMVKVT